VLTYVLVAEGSSDASLVPVINWAISNAGCMYINPIVADFSSLRKKPNSVLDKILACRSLYREADIVVVHRDSDNVGWNCRRREVEEAWSQSAYTKGCVPLIPVAMTEAWLLVDPIAILRSLSNPNGNVPVEFPAIGSLENIRNPKECLFRHDQQMSGLSRRRQEQINVFQVRSGISKYISDYSLLRKIPSFARFEDDLIEAMNMVAF